MLNDFENSNVVRFDEHVWEVQFHPEFNADIARMHVKHFNEIGITIDN
jgi:GMP synthase-like glutamine amidotransferase